MADGEKLCIRQLDERSYCAIWITHIKATLEAKGHNDAVGLVDSKAVYVDAKLQASNIIFSTLTDQEFRDSMTMNSTQQ